MNKKGFTLVELLAILAILGTIVAIAVPNIGKQIEKSEEEKQNIMNTKIENAIKLYAAKHYANKIINGTSFSFKLSDLEDEGLVELGSECSGYKENRIGFDAINAKFIVSNRIPKTCYSGKMKGYVSNIVSAEAEEEATESEESLEEEELAEESTTEDEKEDDAMWYYLKYGEDDDEYITKYDGNVTESQWGEAFNTFNSNEPLRIKINYNENDNYYVLIAEKLNGFDNLRLDVSGGYKNISDGASLQFFSNINCKNITAPSKCSAQSETEYFGENEANNNQKWHITDEDNGHILSINDENNSIFYVKYANSKLYLTSTKAEATKFEFEPDF